MAKAGRPKGVKNPPGSKKPGRKVGASKIIERTPEPEVARLKNEIIRLFDQGEVRNLSEAAEFLGLSKSKVYNWKQKDEEWAKLLGFADQVLADRLLTEILQPQVEGKPISMPYVTARFFLVKKIRPEFRDSYKFVMEDSRVMEHLTALRKIKEAEIDAAAKTGKGEATTPVQPEKELKEDKK